MRNLGLAGDDLFDLMKWEDYSGCADFWEEMQPRSDSNGTAKGSFLRESEFKPGIYTD